MRDDRATNWVAITGAPSSGKTSVIATLSTLGHATRSEVARAYIEEQLARGLTLDMIRSQDAARQMQRIIFTRMREMQAALDPAALVFLDRGLPDSISYFRLAALDAAEVIAACRQQLYRAVFLLDRLPVAHDDVRTEDDAAAQQLEDMLWADYESLGYCPVRVPVMPVAARAAFILSRLGPSPLAAPETAA